MQESKNKTHSFGCPVCRKAEISITGGEVINCPKCNALIRYNWKPPFTQLDAMCPIHDAEVMIDGEWIPFILPPTVEPPPKKQMYAACLNLDF